LIDDRFKAIFDDPEFEIDENSAEFKLLHPTAKKQDSDVRISNLKESDDKSNERAKSYDTKREIRRHRTNQGSEKDAAMPIMKPVLRKQLASHNSFNEQLATLADKEGSSSKYTSKVHRGAKGEMEMSFISKPKSKFRKAVRTESQGGRKEQHFEGRRRASKNAFRGM
jgi:ribosome biogenesis protein ENP2